MRLLLTNTGLSNLVPAQVIHALMRCVLIIGLISGWCGLRSASAHAGHDDIPEASVAEVGELKPRFYSRSEFIDATLVLDTSTSEIAAQLFLMDHTTNKPVSADELRAEQITPTMATLKTANGDTSGIYLLTGLSDLGETATVSIEVSSGDIFDVLSFNNIIRPEDQDAHDADANDGHANAGALPPYMLQGIIAANALVALLAIIALLKYIFGRSRKGSISMLLVAGAAMMLAIPDVARAHSGDDHSGQGLVSPASGPNQNAKHFVNVETQLRGEVFTSAVQSLTIPRSFSALGRVSVRPDLEAAITAPADGLLFKSPDKEKVPIVGQKVQQGETLILLQMIIPAEDKITINTEKALAEADLKQAQQQTLLARQELERSVRLGEYVSQSERDQLKTNFEVARQKEAGLREQIITLSAAIEGETSSVKTLEIRAPISGVISESHSTMGEYINSGKALFRIVNIDEVFVAADIFESDLRAIENATMARIYVEGYPDREFRGTLQSISPEIDPLRRTARVLFEVENKENLLRGGMFARLEVEIGEAQPTLVVPKSAVVAGDSIKQVYRKIAPELFEAVPVKVERFLDVNAVVTAPVLKAGDIIVTQGQYQVRMAPVVGGE